MKKHKGSTSSDWEVILLGADSTEIQAPEYRAKQKGVFGADFLVLLKKTKQNKELEAIYYPSKGYNEYVCFPCGLEQYAALNLGGKSTHTDLKEWTWHGSKWTTIIQKCKLQATIL